MPTQTPTKLLGEGLCSVLLKKLHPKNLVAEAFPNFIANQRLANLVAVRQGTRRGSGTLNRNAVFFSTESIPGIEL